MVTGYLVSDMVGVSICVNETRLPFWLRINVIGFNQPIAPLVIVRVKYPDFDENVVFVAIG